MATEERAPLLELIESLQYARLSTAAQALDEEGRDRTIDAVSAGLIAANVVERPVVNLWSRPEPWAPLRVTVSTTESEERAPHSMARRLQFPLGATGVVVKPDEVLATLRSFPCWVRCVGQIEPLLRTATDAKQSGGVSHTFPLESMTAYLAGRRMAWLVIGTPRPKTVVDRELQSLSEELFRLRSSMAETSRVEVERRETWFRELMRAGHHGAWDVSVLVGSDEPAEALPVAAMLCSAAEHALELHRLIPAPEVLDSSIWREGGPTLPGNGSELPYFTATTEALAALVRPPRQELPGLHVVDEPAFDTSIDESPADGAAIELGSVLDHFRRPSQPMSVRLSTLNRHSFVAGATGSGKSQTVRSLLEALARLKSPVPWLAVEPVKSEYGRMAGRLADHASDPVLIIAPGAVDAPPALLNPLEPASLELGNPDRTYPLQSHADLVRALFLAAFEAQDPFPQVLGRALSECYDQSGWDLVTGRALRAWDPDSGLPVELGTPSSATPRYPTLGDMQRVARTVVEEIGYGDVVQQNVRGFVDVRIGSLRYGAPGRFFEGGHPLDFGSVLKRNTVFQIEGVTNDQDKAFVIGAVLIRLYEQLFLEERERFANEGGSATLRHLTVVEEAHRLLRHVPADSPQAHSLELFADILAESRSYGEGVVVVEQIPSKLIPDVVKNSAFKMMHRLPARDDRDFVGATMNLSEPQSEYVVTLRPGMGAAFVDGMDHPVLVSMPNDGEQRESLEGASVVAPTVEGRSRSRACDAACQEGDRCTLAMIRSGQLVVRDDPLLTLWVEVAVAAHIYGVRTPQFRDAPAYRRLRKGFESNSRLIHCAIATACEEAIGSRYSLLSHFYDPDALLVHIASITAESIENASYDGCTPHWGNWRAGTARYGDLVSLLQEMSKGASRMSSKDLAERLVQRGVDPDGLTRVEVGQTLEGLTVQYRETDERRLLVGISDPAPTALFTSARRLVPGSNNVVAGAIDRFFTWGPTKSDRVKNFLEALQVAASSTSGEAVPQSSAAKSRAPAATS